MRRGTSPSTLWAIVLLLSISGAASSAGAQSLTLDDYFSAALKRSEVVATQAELIRQAEERYTQARATTFPALDGIASHTRQESVPPVAGAATPSSRQSAARLQVTQPIFRGFREFAALRQTKALIGAQHEDYAGARVQLFKDVAENFYDVLTLEQELKNVEAQIEQTAQRERELQNRVRIGRSRTTEVLTVQSSINTLRAEAEQLRRQIQVAREAFAFLSGLNAATALLDNQAVPADLEPLPEYLARTELRPDVKASQQRLVAADENIAIARGARLPSVDLTGNYYLERSGGTLGDVDWDVQLALTMPLYAGGAIQSQVREAVSQRTQAELNTSQVSRLAEQEIRAAYQSVALDRAQVNALERATASARKNYDALTREYRLGLVTNLDVLQALTAFQENQRALDRVRYAVKLDYLRLQAAAVRRPLDEGAAR